MGHFLILQIDLTFIHLTMFILFIFSVLQFSSAAQGRCERDAWGEWLLSVQREIPPQQWRVFQKQTFRLAMNCMSGQQPSASNSQPWTQTPPQPPAAMYQQPPQQQQPHHGQFQPMCNTPQQPQAQQQPFMAPTPPMQTRTSQCPGQQVFFFLIPYIVKCYF